MARGTTPWFAVWLMEALASMVGESTVRRTTETINAPAGASVNEEQERFWNDAAGSL